MIATVDVIVPLPPRGLSPNYKGAWRTHAKIKKDYRAAVALCVLGHKPATGMCEVSLTFGIKNARKLGLWCPRDVDNAIAAFKAGFDGLTDARVIMNDDRKHMSLGKVEIDSTWGPGVRVTISEDR